MVIRDPRLEFFVIVRLAEPAGVRELQADHEAVERAERLAMGVLAFAEQRGQPGAVRRGGERLIRIRPAVRSDGGRFAAPDQLRAAESEVAPPPPRVLARRAIGIRVPTFHRMNAPAIADGESADRDWLGER